MSINIGDLLRQTREEKNMTIEQVSEETKIQKRYLIALEDERYEELPGEVHVKGFMRNYCKAIGLNPNEVVDMYKEQKGEKFISSSEKPEMKEKKSKITHAIILIIIIAIAGIIVFNFILSKAEPEKIEQNYEKIESVETYKEKIEESPEEVSVEIETETKTEKESEKIVEEIETVNSEGLIEAAEESAAEENSEKEIQLTETNNESDKSDEIEPKEEIVEENIAEEEIAEKKEEIQDSVYTKRIKIKVEGKSWIEIRKNNLIVYSGIMEKEEVLYRGKEKDNFEIKIGNAGGVRLIYNDEDLGVLGKPRQVIRKKF